MWRKLAVRGELSKAGAELRANLEEGFVSPRDLESIASYYGLVQPKEALGWMVIPVNGRKYIFLRGELFGYLGDDVAIVLRSHVTLEDLHWSMIRVLAGLPVSEPKIEVKSYLLECKGISKRFECRKRAVAFGNALVHAYKMIDCDVSYTITDSEREPEVRNA